MNGEVEVVTAEDHEVEGLQATGVDHATPIEVHRTRQQCVTIGEVCENDQHRRARKTKMQRS